MSYKILMMRIPIDLTTYILGDNQYEICNTYKPCWSLKNKPSSIAFHFVREGVAKYDWQTAYINTHFNPAHILKKSLEGGEKR